MENIKVTVFGKKQDGKTRFWMSVHSKNKDNEDVSASVTVSLSEKAKEVFLENMENTKNDEIKKLYVEITDAWLKAVKGKDENFAVLFVNKMRKAESKETAKKKGSW